MTLTMPITKVRVPQLKSRSPMRANRIVAATGLSVASCRFVTAIKLSRLLEGVDVREAPPADPEVTGLCYDSRRLKAGDCFVAIPGTHTDGHRYTFQPKLHDNSSKTVFGQSGNWNGDDIALYHYGLWPGEPWKIRLEFSQQSEFADDASWALPNIPLVPVHQQAIVGHATDGGGGEQREVRKRGRVYDVIAAPVAQQVPEDT